MKLHKQYKFLIASLTALGLSACAGQAGYGNQTVAQNAQQNIQGVHAYHGSTSAFARLKANAEQGDPDAQYGIGYRYYYGIGVKQDTAKSLAWFEQAATHGQTQARQALKLIKEAEGRLAMQEGRIAPTSITSDVAANSKPAVVADASSEGYTLQLMGSADKDSLVSFIVDKKLQDKATYYKKKANGHDWYVLVAGRYNTQQEALAAIHGLPEDMKRLNPWVKPLAMVKKEMQG